MWGFHFLFLSENIYFVVLSFTLTFSLSVGARFSCAHTLRMPSQSNDSHYERSHTIVNIYRTEWKASESGAPAHRKAAQKLKVYTMSVHPWPFLYAPVLRPWCLNIFSKVVLKKKTVWETEWEKVISRCSSMDTGRDQRVQSFLSAFITELLRTCPLQAWK